MKKLWALSGRIAFWCTWPALWLYLRSSTRTRVIVHAEGKILVHKKWLGNGGWALPGGGLHGGEDSRLGAVRETYEEAGIQLDPKQLVSHGNHTYHGKGFRFRYDLYSIELPKQLPTRNQRLEILQTAWLAPSELTERTTTKEVLGDLKVWRP